MYSYVISAIVGLACFSKIASRSFRLLAAFWAFSVAFDLNIERFDAGDGRTIRLFYCLYYPFALIIYVYIFNAERSWKSVRYWLQWLAISVVTFIACFQIFKNLDENSAANTVFIVQAFGIFLVVLPYFSDVLISRQYIEPLKEPLFLVASALLLYTSGNLIGTGFFHQLFSYSKELAHNLYKLNYLMNIIMSILFSAAFIRSTQKAKNYSDEY